MTDFIDMRLREGAAPKMPLEVCLMNLLFNDGGMKRPEDMTVQGEEGLALGLAEVGQVIVDLGRGDGGTMGRHPMLTLLS